MSIVIGDQNSDILISRPWPFTTYAEESMHPEHDEGYMLDLSIGWPCRNGGFLNARKLSIPIPYLLNFDLLSTQPFLRLFGEFIPFP